MRELLLDGVVAQHLEVLNGDRVAVVVVGDHLCLDAKTLRLFRSLHHGAALVANRGGTLLNHVPQLIEAARRNVTAGVLPRRRGGRTARCGEATRNTEESTKDAGTNAASRRGSLRLAAAAPLLGDATAGDDKHLERVPPLSI